MPDIETQCPCGHIQLRISGEALVHTYCHCEDCRAANGAAYVATAVYPAAAVTIEKGQPIQLVIKTTPRVRCGNCGTPLFTEVKGAGLRSLNAYLLPKGEFRPSFHVQCQDAVLPVVDELPHYKGFPAMFGGTDEIVPW